MTRKSRLRRHKHIHRHRRTKRQHRGGSGAEKGLYRFVVNDRVLGYNPSTEEIKFVKLDSTYAAAIQYNPANKSCELWMLDETSNEYESSGIYLICGVGKIIVSDSPGSTLQINDQHEVKCNDKTYFYRGQQVLAEPIGGGNILL